MLFICWDYPFYSLHISRYGALLLFNFGLCYGWWLMVSLLHQWVCIPKLELGDEGNLSCFTIAIVAILFLIVRITHFTYKAVIISLYLVVSNRYNFIILVICNILFFTCVEFKGQVMNMNFFNLFIKVYFHHLTPIPGTMEATSSSKASLDVLKPRDFLGLLFNMLDKL